MRRPSSLQVVAAAAAALAIGVAAAGILLAPQADTGTTGIDAAGPRGLEPVPTDARRAPPLEGTDPITGGTVRLADFRGKPVVINVWASWCPGCNDEAQDLRDFAAAHPEAVVLGLDYRDTVAGAKRFYRRWAWRHPSIFDPSGAKSRELGVVGLPTTYFLDPRHRVVARIAGATDRRGFERGLTLATS